MAKIVINPYTGQMDEVGGGASLSTGAPISGATPSTVLVTDSSGDLASSTVTTTQLDNLIGSTSNIQTQINSKEPTITTLPISKGGTNSSIALTGNKAVISNGSQIIESSTTATEISYVSGVTSAIQTQINNKISSTEKGANNGVATLDAGGKVPVTQLPSSVMEYQGTYNPNTNTPALANGTGNTGDVYLVSTAGSHDFGAGSITFAIGDWVIYNGSIWQKSLNSNAVVSVNGQTGVVSLTAADVSAADTALSNLASTAVNVSITPATDNNISLGNNIKRFSEVHTLSIRGNGASPSIDIQSGYLKNSAGDVTVIYDSSGLVEATGDISVDWKNKLLKSSATTKIDWSGTDVSLNTHKLTNVVDPINPQDAATMNYVDTAVSGVAGANFSLSNLTPTSINKDLISDGMLPRFLGSDVIPWYGLYALSIRGSSTVDVIGIDQHQLYDTAGSISVDFSDTTNLTTYRNLIMDSPSAFIKTPDTAGISEILNVTTGDSTGDETGALNLMTGNSTADNSGGINISTGNSAANSGNITLSTGTSVGPRGAVILNVDAVNPVFTNNTTLGTGSLSFLSAAIQTLVDASDVQSIGVNSRQLVTASNAVGLSWNDTAIDVNNKPITNVTDPVNAQDAATKAYVLAQVGGAGITALTGDVTASGSGSVAATIANLAVTNAKIANATIDLTAKVTGVLPIANGGTNSSASLSNNRVVQSSSGALVEAAAITASRALISDITGIPTHSTVTDTELGYVSGVTSAIQTQFIGKASTTLNNLGTTALNANILPDVAGTRSIGVTGTRFASMSATTFGATDGTNSLLLTSNVVSGYPNTGTYSLHPSTGATVDMALDTANNATVNAAATLSIHINTGNKTAGTGNSGNIIIGTGTSAGGTRGTVSLDGSAITLTPVTASRALTTDSSKNIVASATTDTELGYVSGVTSSIQTQINSKQNRQLSITTQTSATYSVVITDDVVICNPTTAQTVTLYTPVGNTGRTISIKNITNQVITVATAAGNIDGNSTQLISTQYNSITVVSDGTNWYQI